MYSPAYNDKTQYRNMFYYWVILSITILEMWSLLWEWDKEQYKCRIAYTETNQIHLIRDITESYLTCTKTWFICEIYYNDPEYYWKKNPTSYRYKMTRYEMK